MEPVTWIRLTVGLLNADWFETNRPTDGSKLPSEGQNTSLLIIIIYDRGSFLLADSISAGPIVMVTLVPSITVILVMIYRPPVVTLIDNIPAPASFIFMCSAGRVIALLVPAI